ncbi:MAG: TrmJ/YjtD family RNA methyltransferase [Vicinamibacteria bacterium]
MDLSRVEVVLVRPARAANVAAACRAMKNMGLRRLSIVDPPAALLDHEARALAYGAWDVLDAARRAADLGEAVAGSALVVGTSGRDARGAWTARDFGERAAEASRGGDVSVVFGPESSGLAGRELDLCHRLVHVPTAPAHPSLNLAQAVLLLGYELRLASLRQAAPAPPEDASPAPAGELEAAVGELRAALLAVGYLDPASPDRVLTELRRLLARAGPTAREVTLLRGLARQVEWAGRVAKGRPAGR